MLRQKEHEKKQKKRLEQVFVLSLWGEGLVSIDHGLCHGYLIALFHMVYCFLSLYGVQEKSLM